MENHNGFDIEDQALKFIQGLYVNPPKIEEEEPTTIVDADKPPPAPVDEKVENPIEEETQRPPTPPLDIDDAEDDSDIPELTPIENSAENTIENLIENPTSVSYPPTNPLLYDQNIVKVLTPNKIIANGVPRKIVNQIRKSINAGNVNDGLNWINEMARHQFEQSHLYSSNLIKYRENIDTIIKKITDKIDADDAEHRDPSGDRTLNIQLHSINSIKESVNFLINNPKVPNVDAINKLRANINNKGVAIQKLLEDVGRIETTIVAENSEHSQTLDLLRGALEEDGDVFYDASETPLAENQQPSELVNNSRLKKLSDFAAKLSKRVVDIATSTLPTSAKVHIGDPESIVKSPNVRDINMDFLKRIAELSIKSIVDVMGQIKTTEIIRNKQVAVVNNVIDIVLQDISLVSTKSVNSFLTTIAKRQRTNDRNAIFLDEKEKRKAKYSNKKTPTLLSKIAAAIKRKLATNEEEEIENGDDSLYKIDKDDPGLNFVHTRIEYDGNYKRSKVSRDKAHLEPIVEDGDKIVFNVSENSNTVNTNIQSGHESDAETEVDSVNGPEPPTAAT